MANSPWWDIFDPRTAVQDIKDVGQGIGSLVGVAARQWGAGGGGGGGPKPADVTVNWDQNTQLQSIMANMGAVGGPSDTGTAQQILNYVQATDPSALANHQSLSDYITSYYAPKAGYGTPETLPGSARSAQNALDPLALQQFFSQTIAPYLDQYQSRENQIAKQAGGQLGADYMKLAQTSVAAGLEQPQIQAFQNTANSALAQAQTNAAQNAALKALSAAQTPNPVPKYNASGTRIG